MQSKMFLQGLRVAFVFCLYFLTLACYLTPILVTKYWGSKNLLISSPSRALKSKQLGLRCISWCNCTAAGIFLGMCFLGLLPYVEEKFHTIFKMLEYDIEFPVTECVVVIGFFITLIIEQSVLSWQERREAGLQDDVEQGQGLLEECEMQDLSDDPSLTHEDHSQRLVNDIHADNASNSQHTKYTEENHTNVSDAPATSDEGQLDQGHTHLSMLMSRESGFHFFVLAFATGMHSIFEGITLGLQTDISKAIHLFIAIIIHECLVAIALGVNSTRLRYSFVSYLKFAVVFSAAIPVGLLIGVAVERAPGISGDIASAVLQGLAAGIFLHVTFQGFLPAEFSNKQDRLLKVLFLFLGFLIIAAITFFISEF